MGKITAANLARGNTINSQKSVYWNKYKKYSELAEQNLKDREKCIELLGKAKSIIPHLESAHSCIKDTFSNISGGGLIVRGNPYASAQLSSYSGEIEEIIIMIQGFEANVNEAITKLYEEYLRNNNSANTYKTLYDNEPKYI